MTRYCVVHDWQEMGRSGSVVQLMCINCGAESARVIGGRPRPGEGWSIGITAKDIQVDPFARGTPQRVTSEDVEMPEGTQTGRLSVNDTYGYQVPPPPTQEDLRLGLAFLMQAQLPTLQAAGQDSVDKEILRQYGIALSIEVSEFLNETPWKEWKTYEGGADPEKIVAEFVDVLHFMGTWVALMRHWGIHPSEIAKTFVEKNLENRKRFAGEVEGYGWAAAQEGGLE